MEAERLDTWVSLAQAHAAVSDLIEQRLQCEQGLPLAWFDVLLCLDSSADQHMRMRDLAQTVLLSKSGVTRLVDRMGLAGMVTRGSCPTDRRVVYAVITDLGVETLRRAMPTYLAGVDEYFSKHLRDQDDRALRALLRRVLEGNGRSSASVELVPATG